MGRLQVGIHAVDTGDGVAITDIYLTCLTTIVAGLAFACDTEPIKPRLKQSVAVIALAHRLFTFHHYFIPLTPANTGLSHLLCNFILVRLSDFQHNQSKVHAWTGAY